MKFSRFLFSLLCVFNLNTAFASTLESLDREQSKLAIDYIELSQAVPSIDELQKLALTGNSVLVLESMNKIRKFFNDYDQFNLKKIDFFHAKVLEHARLVASEHIKLFGELPKKAQEKLTLLELQISKYLSLKHHFGTEGDTERLWESHKIFPAYGDFANSIRLDRGEKTWRKYGGGKIVPFVDTIGDALRISDRFVALLWSAYVVDQAHKQDKAPIPQSLINIQSRLVKMRKIETKWDGLENLQDLSHDGKTVNMFLLNHAHSFLDSSAQQAFPVKGISAVGNMNFFPKFLSKRMETSRHMVAVGYGDTTAKTIEMVKNKQLNKFFLAIEGLTNTGLFEMRPVMPLFSMAVYDSINRGLNLQLYPIAFPDNFRLLNDWRSPIEGFGVARGLLFKPINNDICMGLYNITKDTYSIAELIRWIWFTSLRNNSEEVLSMPYPSEIARRMNMMIWE
jgi:hypothetical protein